MENAHSNHHVEWEYEERSARLARLCRLLHTPVTCIHYSFKLLTCCTSTTGGFYPSLFLTSNHTKTKNICFESKRCNSCPCRPPAQGTWAISVAWRIPQSKGEKENLWKKTHLLANIQAKFLIKQDIISNSLTSLVLLMAWILNHLDKTYWNTGRNDPSGPINWCISSLDGLLIHV